MAARRGVACSGVPGMFEEADMFASRLVYGRMCGCARDTDSQGVGSRDADGGLLSAKEPLSQNRLHVCVCLVFHSRRPACEWWWW